MAYRKNETEHKELTSQLRTTEYGNAAPVITVDYERYAHMLDDPDLTEDQKREFLQVLWNIIVEFVSLGWGVHPLQQVQTPCGKDEDISSNPALTAPDEVYLDQDLIEKFICAADLKADRLEEESVHE